MQTKTLQEDKMLSWEGIQTDNR